MKAAETNQEQPALGAWSHDLVAGVVVFLVALPLCLGIAVASNAPPFTGILAGIVGGLVVGALSGSGSSVSGPAAGLTAVVATQVHAIGSLDGFLTAVVLAGALQLALGLARLGKLAQFMPSSVIKGLLAAIGAILIVKQFPVALGCEPLAPETGAEEGGIHAFLQRIHPGSAFVGAASILVMVAWHRFKVLKKSPVPAPLAVVALGVALAEVSRWIPGLGPLDGSLLVSVPSAATAGEFIGLLSHPDFSRIGDPVVITAAFTVAAVASIETLLNLEAVDKLDPLKRRSPPNRELVAQGVGNIVAGLIGGLPVTSVVVRGSVNLDMGARTKASAIIHGILLLVCVALMPWLLNTIPLSCLAAILIATGFKLASPALVVEKWCKGANQFLPFAVTVAAIVTTDLLIGILAGLAVQVALNLWGGASVSSTFRARVGMEPLEEGHGRAVVGDAATFSNWVHIRARLVSGGMGSTVVLDLAGTVFIDTTVMEKIRELQHEFERAGGTLRVEGLEDHKPATSHPTASRRRLVRKSAAEPKTGE